MMSLDDIEDLSRSFDETDEDDDLEGKGTAWSNLTMRSPTPPLRKSSRDSMTAASRWSYQEGSRDNCDTETYSFSSEDNISEQQTSISDRFLPRINVEYPTSDDVVVAARQVAHDNGVKMYVEKYEPINYEPVVVQESFPDILISTQKSVEKGGVPIEIVRMPVEAKELLPNTEYPSLSQDNPVEMSTPVEISTPKIDIFPKRTSLNELPSSMIRVSPPPRETLPTEQELSTYAAATAKTTIPTPTTMPETVPDNRSKSKQRKRLFKNTLKKMANLCEYDARKATVSTDRWTNQSKPDITQDPVESQFVVRIEQTQLNDTSNGSPLLFSKQISTNNVNGTVDRLKSLESSTASVRPLSTVPSTPSTSQPSKSSFFSNTPKRKNNHVSFNLTKNKCTEFMADDAPMHTSRGRFVLGYLNERGNVPGEETEDEIANSNMHLFSTSVPKRNSVLPTTFTIKTIAPQQHETVPPLFLTQTSERPHVFQESKKNQITFFSPQTQRRQVIQTPRVALSPQPITSVIYRPQQQSTIKYIHEAEFRRPRQSNDPRTSTVYQLR